MKIIAGSLMHSRTHLLVVTVLIGISILAARSALAASGPSFAVVELMGNLEDANWVSVQSLWNVGAEQLKDLKVAVTLVDRKAFDREFHSTDDASEKEYFEAYFDYAKDMKSHVTVERFADNVIKRSGSHTKTYLLTSLRILRQSFGHQVPANGVAPPSRMKLYLAIRAIKDTDCVSPADFVLLMDASETWLGDNQRARALGLQAIQRFPRNLVLWDFAAACFESYSPSLPQSSTYSRPGTLHQPDFSEAIKLRKTILSYDPNYVHVYYHLASTYIRSGQLIAARKCLDSYFKKFGPDAPDYSRNRILLSQCGS